MTDHTIPDQADSIDNLDHILNQLAAHTFGVIPTDYQPGLDHAKKRLESYCNKQGVLGRIDEQKQHCMTQNPNPDCQGCYNNVSAHSDRLAELKAELAPQLHTGKAKPDIYDGYPDES